MKDIITIKKGLDLPISGRAELRVINARGIDLYAVKPQDIVGFTPRLLVAEGYAVTAGQPLVADKKDPRLALTSPVDGTVEAIVRGEKRALLEVRIRAKERTSKGKKPSTPKTADELRQLLIERGLWWAIKERPFGTIANPDHQPKGIFVTMMDTAPLAPDMEFCIKGKEHELEIGLQALSLIAPVHVGVAEGTAHHTLSGVQYHTFRGPHPTGNIGTQIEKIDPINKGEWVWVVGAQEVAMIGHLLATGEYLPEKVIACAGPAAKAPHYYRLLCGASLEKINRCQEMELNYPSLNDEKMGTRIISGNVLNGTQIARDGFLGTYDYMVSYLPEGNYYDFMGWLMPGVHKYSLSNTFLSGLITNLTPKFCRKYLNEKLEGCTKFDTNVHGSVRPLMFTGNFEKVFPFDIYPMQLIKACVVGDMELQEQLGIYEVEPEDFALCEFVDPSKTDIQTIIRQSLEALRKEATA